MERFRRVAIVNRGEAAMRLVHAAREHVDGDLVTVALHTAAERRAMFVREADEAVCLDELGITPEGSPYLDLGILEAALLAGRAEAAWVGWGFVAERPEFADLCDRLGVRFVGPPGGVMRLLGDKIAAKRLAEEAGVPLAPWSGGPVGTVDAALAAAGEVGFPLMVKAAAGGGGRGIRRVERMEDLPSAVERAGSEAAAAFGDPTLFLERVVTGARHVEVQIVADDHGTVWAPGVRDCSIQRRNQKVIEESHSTALAPDDERSLRDAAVRLAQAAGYRGAGTVEFLHRPEDGVTTFLEVNTRLQVEHPVTEVTAGIDLVQLQLHVAMGGRLEGDCPPSRGHAFEARLNAEDPAAGFAPSPGRVRSLVLPTGPGVRVDTGIGPGDQISPEYDSMVAKIVAWGPDRDTARVRLRRALLETTVVIEGGTTNKSFLLDIVDRAEVVEGSADTGWLDRLTDTDGHRSDRLADVALMAAAIDVHEAELDLDRRRFLGTAARGRPESSGGGGHVVELRWRGAEHRVLVASGDLDGWYRLTLAGSSVDVVIDRAGDGRARLRVGDQQHRVVSQAFRTEHLVEVDGVSHRFTRDDAGLVRAPAVSLVVAVEVAAGDEVVAGQRVAVVEAMKMETSVVAPIDGVVEEVLVEPNTQVEAGTALVRIAAAEVRSERAEPTASLRFSPLPPDPRPDGRIDTLRAMFLGFDLGAADVPVPTPRDGPDAGRRELDLLDAFADLCGLTRERRTAGQDRAVELRSPREHFNAYLRSFDPDHEGLPEHFRQRLLVALGHYGVGSLDRTPTLEAAVHRIHLAAQRRDEQLPAVVDLLERQLDGGDPPPEPDRLRDTLDHLIAATQARYPTIGNLARSVRHRLVDRPLLGAARAEAEAEVLAAVDALVVDPEDAAVAERLVESPVALMPVIVARGAMGHGVAVTAAFVEVLTRRYYRIRELQEPVRYGQRRRFRLRALRDPVRRAARRPSFAARYHHRDREVRVVAVAGELRELDRLVDDLAPLLDEDRHGETVVDLYLRLPASATDDDVVAAVDRTLAGAHLPERVSRVTVVAVTTGDAAPVLTWERQPGGYVELVAYRSLHPMIGRRLELWRLENFEVRRLPGPPDTHVFDCVARDQPSDERLVAVAEVRDFTPLRDADGTLVALPELERVLAACLDGIRGAQAADADRQRLEWNRVMLYVWPPVEIGLDEIDTVARRLAPLTDGLGIEQVVVQGRLVDAGTGAGEDVAVRFGHQVGAGLTFRVTAPPTAPMEPLDDLTRKVLQCRRRGAVHPFELVPLLTGPATAPGSFIELDLDEAGRLVPVDRPPGRNTAGVVVGVATTVTGLHPEGMARVVVFGDPTMSMGAIAEPECRRLLAALDLAEERGVPIDWFALSAGARIAMDSGSENLDWVAAVLRRIVRFTEDGRGRPNREINVVVAGVNVGAQPYWNAEATMLMHTRGILVMTPDSAMVLTGKQAIDFSGGVSADDNVGIGGHERVMGPNGQAQYWAPDIGAAVDVLLAHHRHTYVHPGEAGPRRAPTSDPHDRDVRGEPHEGAGTTFRTVGEIFSDETNAGRKQPFDIRSVMHAVRDHDHEPLERWADMAEAEGAVVMDARLGGHSVCMLGIESRPLPRSGTLPADGPSQWAAGTLHPLSSKKVARAINASSGSRPVVVLANLSGFDGSPESLRRLQLEYGAEIGRAIVDFDGPIVLCVLSRYHGGAFVVFSGRLNDRMQVLAVEGAHASVIGGAPAAAVVFAREVNARTQADERVRRLEAAIAAAPAHEQAQHRAELASTRATVRNEVLGAVAAEFDAVHSVARAQRVGSVHAVIEAARLRPELIAAVERGLANTRP